MFGVGIVAAFSVVSTATAAVTTTDIPLLALPRLIDSSVAKTAEIRYQAVQEAGVPSSALGKVVGGTEADYGAYPFFVRLRPLLGTSKCGGSLVAPDVVLTAAHCNGNFENFAVSVNGYTASLLNNQDEEETESVEKLPHPDFVLDTFANDYMLLKLKDPIETIEPVTLNFDGAVPGFVEDLRVIGLGTIQEGGQFPNFLREVIVQHADMELCQKAYADAGLNLVREEIMFCAQGDKKDACQGDSGV
jgi:secreted trypsin-like serine protease